MDRKRRMLLRRNVLACSVLSLLPSPSHTAWCTTIRPPARASYTTAWRTPETGVPKEKGWRSRAVGANPVMLGFCSPPSEKDRVLFEKERLASPVAGIAKERCRHGFPQVLLYYPLFTTIRGTRAERVATNTGGPWLRCPLLIREMDRWEKKGMLDSFAQRVNEDPALKEKLQRLHTVVVPKLRRALLHPEWRKRLADDPAYQGIQKLFDTGFLGVLQVDNVKCLHGHLADYLLRSGSGVMKPSRTQQERPPSDQPVEEDDDLYFENPIGRIIYDELVASGFEVTGNPSCRRLCSNDKREE